MCTNFKNKKAKDGSVVVGRTMEFPLKMVPWSLGALPSDYEGEGAAPKGSASKGKAWKAKYGIVGMAAFETPNWFADGISEAGLSAHLLYMDGFCTYQDFKGDGNDLSELDIIAFFLGTCSSLAEVREAAADVNVWGMDPGLGFAPPLHLLMHDKDGSLAIEFHPEGHRIVDNPLGVGTNTPYMEWHHLNVENYVGLSTTNPDPVTINGVKLETHGTGQGMMGLPGDSTPPSRYVRALAQVATSEEQADGHASEQMALHILNNFDITPGLIRMPGPGGEPSDEVTCWSTISNLTDLRYGYRTIGDPTTSVIELGETDFSSSSRTVKLSETGKFTPAAI